MAPTFEEALARSVVYELLSLGFLYPVPGTAALLGKKAGGIASIAARLGWQEMSRILEQLSGQVRPLEDSALVSEYIGIFGHSVSSDCPPYEAEYGQAHIFQKSQTLADLSTFYKAFGVTPNADLRDRPDHISVQMEFMHLLTLKEAYAQLRGHGEGKIALCRDAQRAFLSQHLANWVQAFAHRVRRKAEDGSPFGTLACLLQIHMGTEFRDFRINPTPGPEPPIPVAQEGSGDCEDCAFAPNTALESGLP